MIDQTRHRIHGEGASRLDIEERIKDELLTIRRSTNRDDTRDRGVSWIKVELSVGSAVNF